MRKTVVIWLSIFLTLVVLSVFDANAATTEIKEVEEVVNYSTDIIYDDTVREGDMEVTQEGKNGSKIVTYSITYKYGKEMSRAAKSEKIIEPAQNKKIVEGTKKYYTCSNGTEYDNINDKNECENKISWAKQRDASLQECYSDSSKFDCWYDEYPGTTLHWSYYTYNNYTDNTMRTGAICKDGWRSTATGRGACSHHGGVAYWI